MPDTTPVNPPEPSLRSPLAGGLLRRPGPIGRRLALLLAVVLLLLMGTFAVVTWQDHRDTLEDGWQRTSRAAEAAAEHADRALSAARMVTERLAETTRIGGLEAFRGEAWPQLAAAMRHAPQIGSIWLIDADGRVVTNTLERQPPRGSLADRPYFAPLRDGVDSHLTPLLAGRLSGIWFFSYNHAIRDHAGRFLGIVQAGMHEEDFARISAGLGLGSSGRTALLLRDGAAPLMLWPLPPPTADGEPPVPTPGMLDAQRRALTSTAAGGRIEVTETATGERLLAWQGADAGRVVATASVARAEVLAPFRARLWRNLGVLALSWALVAALGLAVIRAMGRAAEARAMALTRQRELSAILEATTEGVLALDAAWRITYVNRRAAAMLGGAGPLLGRHMADAFPGSEEFLAAYRQTMEQRIPARVEATYAGLGRRFQAESHPREDGGISVFFRDVTDEHRTGTRLAESESRLRRLFSAIDEGYCLCEMLLDGAGRPADYRFLEANRPFEAMTGLHDPVGRTVLELIPGIERHWIDTYARVALEGEALRFQERSEVMGRSFDVFATPVEPRGRFALVFRDITAEQEARAALAASEARLRRAQEAGGVGIWEWEIGTDHAFWSDTLRRMIGLGTEAPARFRRFLERVHPADRAGVEEAMRHAATTPGQRFEAEFRIRRADTGEERWLAGRAEAERDGEGRAVRLLGVTLDITERRLAEAALAESEARLRLAQEAAQIGVFERDLRTGTAHWSPTLFRIYGIDPNGRSPLMGDEEYLRMLVDEDRERHRGRRDARRADPTASYFHHEFRIRRQDTGEVRWIASRGEVVRDAEGQPVTVRGTNHDITDRRRAEERQMLLAREVDHRAKNALAVVQSIVGLTRTDDPARFRAAVTGRIAAMARAHTLLAREGWRSADLRDLVEAEMAPHRTGEGGEDRVVLDGPLVSLVAAAVQPLSMALHELGTNAVKYGALSVPCGRVLVTWEATEGGGLRLTWTEEGGPRLPSPPDRRGFGSSVIANTVERQLQGRVSLTWADAGLRCEILLPPAQLHWPEPAAAPG